jgi:hypothetical protein
MFFIYFRTLLEYEAAVGAESKAGFTPLHLAAQGSAAVPASHFPAIFFYFPVIFFSNLFPQLFFLLTSSRHFYFYYSRNLFIGCGFFFLCCPLCRQQVF